MGIPRVVKVGQSAVLDPLVLSGPQGTFERVVSIDNSGGGTDLSVLRGEILVQQADGDFIPLTLATLADAITNATTLPVVVFSEDANLTVTAATKGSGVAVFKGVVDASKLVLGAVPLSDSSITATQRLQITALLHAGGIDATVSVG